MTETTMSSASSGQHLRGIGAGAIANRILLWGAFLALSVVCVYPMIWLFLNAFKSTNELFQSSWALPETWRYGNFTTAWGYGISRYLFNSVVVAVATVAIELMLASMAAYALVVMDFKAKIAIYMAILGGMILPPEVSLFPLFKVMAVTEIYNTYFALILPNVAFGLPFTTFLIRAYMLGIPLDLREAALMDGASESLVFRSIYLPLSKPVLASAGLIAAMRVWNEFIFALTFVESDSVKTVTIGVMSFAVALRADYGVMMAGLALSIIPILATFLLLQKQFIGGLTQGAVK
ncbi:carbohydrate ABC transporter permease [Notoacmeibacter ruber]|uniref:sn-glycerol-3-phosphate transport system permease protein UgpE n=1 Tax=Notoacmeibacter ruber TaxID=2670375 RepID=A0A3L7J8D4_9HYPH|nr:carbohydrate ABC transporter permease [Notoacmeibacter ruber]RLQ86998.1 carbohydrate ABC transporter permease [Notoacmeibacter ruber]